MWRDRTEEEMLGLVSDGLDVPLPEVRRAVHSFFSAIFKSARDLPFNDERRIYTKDGFDELSGVWNIPYIGRMGPVYSRYLAWRSNEAKTLEQVSRSRFRKGMTQDEIEHMAEEILAGKTPSPVKKRKVSEMYKRVWMVGKKTRKQARQVIPKK